ncbi:MAG: hypothetical protein MUC88_00225 [Planctomycetes bacterium]|jgi:hypothetical protein|nr:hypothetical protein [Planctomycetota bacterium]
MCNCVFHRYDVVHALQDEQEVFDHSQGTWDSVLAPAHRQGVVVESFPSADYEHGDTADDLRFKLARARAPRMSGKLVYRVQGAVKGGC